MAGEATCEAVLESIEAVTEQKFPPRVRAADGTNESWIVSGYHFFRHGSLDSAIAARHHLATQFPKKQFVIHRVKAKLEASTTRETVQGLRATNAELLHSLQEMLDTFGGADPKDEHGNAVLDRAIAAISKATPTPDAQGG